MFQIKVVEKIKTHILWSVTFSRKFYLLWDNVDDNLIRCMRSACWITNVTNTYSKYVILVSHCNSGYSNTPQCYVNMCFVLWYVHMRSQVLAVVYATWCCNLEIDAQGFRVTSVLFTKRGGKMWSEWYVILRFEYFILSLRPTEKSDRSHWNGHTHSKSASVWTREKSWIILCNLK
jgi:hypothetical protein